MASANTSPVDNVLDRLTGVRRSGAGWTAKCPAHHDAVNSLSVGIGEGNRVLLHCFADCSVAKIAKALGIREPDLFMTNDHRGGSVSLAQYAAAKILPIEFLRGLGLREVRLRGQPAIRIPYFDRNSREIAVRFRCALHGEDRFRWKSGSKLCLYGLDRLDQARKAGYVILPEGESDCHTLWLHGIPAVGLPGANSWKEEWAILLEGIPTIYVVVEPDQGGRAVEKWVGHTRIRSRIRLIKLTSSKDPSALYLADRDAFPAAWRTVMAASVPWVDANDGKNDELLDTAPYRIQDGAICVEKNTQIGPVVVPLCNFAARISEEIVLDDGLERTRAFRIEGSYASGKHLPTIRVPVSRFASMAWIAESWGAKAVVNAGFAVKDQLREAIQRFSTSAIERIVFTSTGWREINGESLYITASGAIGPNGFREGFEVDLGPELGRYALPKTIGDPREAVRQSLRLLDLAPLSVTAPLWAAIFRAPLASACPLDMVLWLEGLTGSLKSTLTALFCSHFGDFERTALPGAWSSTANQLERRAFVLKDSVFPIDDYAPTGLDAREYESKASRLVRSHGNLAGRGRLRPDLSERPTYPPRGLVISTGEQHPALQGSLEARMLVSEVQRERIDLALLTEAQKSRAYLPQAMFAYIRWLAPQMATLPSLLKQSFEGARARATAKREHLRVPEVLAHLWLGLDCALRFAQDIGACTADEAASYSARCWNALLTLGRAQGRLVDGTRPSRRFLQVLVTLVVQGKAVLIPKENSGESDWADGALVGWYDAEFAYLLPEAAFAAVVRFCRDTGELFSIGEGRLRRDLAQEGLSECDPERHTKMIRVRGRSRRTLCLRRQAVEVFLGEELPCSESTVSGISRN